MCLTEVYTQLTVTAHHCIRGKMIRQQTWSQRKVCEHVQDVSFSSTLTKNVNTSSFELKVSLNKQINYGLSHVSL